MTETMDPQAVLEQMVASVGKAPTKTPTALSPVSLEREPFPLNDPAPAAYPNDWPTMSVLNTLDILQHGVNTLQRTLDELRAAVNPVAVNAPTRDVIGEYTEFRQDIAAEDEAKAALVAFMGDTDPVDPQVKFVSDLAAKAARAQSEVFKGVVAEDGQEALEAADWTCPEHGTFKVINVKGEKVRRCTVCAIKPE